MKELFQIQINALRGLAQKSMSQIPLNYYLQTLDSMEGEVLKCFDRHGGSAYFIKLDMTNYGFFQERVSHIDTWFYNTKKYQNEAKDHVLDILNSLQRFNGNYKSNGPRGPEFVKVKIAC